jgi:ribosomal protein S6
VFYTVEFPPESIQKVESVLNITDEVTRFLITRPDLKKIAKAEAARAEKAKRSAERGKSDDQTDEAEKADEE